MAEHYGLEPEDEEHIVNGIVQTVAGWRLFVPRSVVAPREIVWMAPGFRPRESGIGPVPDAGQIDGEMFRRSAVILLRYCN